MSLLRTITSGLRSLFRKEQVDRELEEVLRAYQEIAAEAKMKDGMSRKEAFRAVRLERGSLAGQGLILAGVGALVGIGGAIGVTRYPWLFASGYPRN